MKLRQIKQKRAFELVAEQLEEAILSGEFKPGDKLPPERNTIQELGTSRRSLREALRVLEQKGLIEIKLGVKGGIFIKRPSTESLSNSLEVLIRFKQVSMRELAEFRLDLEGIIARRAAQRADGNDLDRLKKIASKAELALADPNADFGDYKEIDSEYHLALAAAARNQLYASVLRIVHDNMVRYFEKNLDWYKKVFIDHYKEMLEMIEAVENRDGDKAFALATEHIQQFFRYVDSEKENPR